MNNFKSWFPLIFFVAVVAGTTGAVYYVQTTQLQKDIEARMTDLQQTKARLDVAQADLTAARKDLADAQNRSHTVAEANALQGRVDKDQADVQAYVSEILGDVSFLQSQWSSLTPQERDYLSKVQQGLLYS